MHRAVVAIFAGLVGAALAGCNPGAANPAPQAGPDDAAIYGASYATPDPAPGATSSAAPRVAPDPSVGQLAGKPMYLALCAPCHGVEGKGYAADRAPSLVSPTFLESASESFLRRSIIAGRPGTSMAAYGKASGGPLDNAAVDRLVAFLREQAPPVRTLPPVVAGDVPTGAAIYAKQCFVCHGDAKTRGEAVSLANPQLLTAASDAFLRYAVANGRPGTKMEPFRDKLDAAQLDSVVRYIRTLGNGGPAPRGLLPEPTGKEPLVIHPRGKTPAFTLRADPCPPARPGTAPCKPDPRFVSVEQVGKAFAAKQRMVLVDARPPSDWRSVHLEGAVSIPYHDLKRLDEMPRDGTWIIAYCGCPHHLSGIVVDELRKRGFAHAVVLDEGINEWHRRGLPVTAAEGVTRPLPEPRPGGAIR